MPPMAGSRFWLCSCGEIWPCCMYRLALPLDAPQMLQPSQPRAWKEADQAQAGSMAYLRSAEMNRGDLAMDHKAKWDLISSMVSSSLRGSPICTKDFHQHISGKDSHFQAWAAQLVPCRKQESQSPMQMILPGVLHELCFSHGSSIARMPCASTLALVWNADRCGGLLLLTMPADSSQALNSPCMTLIVRSASLYAALQPFSGYGASTS